MSRDPIGEVGGVNGYGFLANRLLGFFDHLGKEAADPEGPVDGNDEKAREEAQRNQEAMANGLFEKLSKLCPTPEEVVVRLRGSTPGAGGWVYSHCCTREVCLEQARVYADNVAQSVTAVALAERLKHGYVLDGWKGNKEYIKDPGTFPPRYVGNVEGGDGLNCSGWRNRMDKTYHDTFRKYGGGWREGERRRELCFRGVNVKRSLYRPFGIPDYVRHEWFVLYGPTSKSITFNEGVSTVDLTNPDITLDPWQTGGLSLDPSEKEYVASGAISLTSW